MIIIRKRSEEKEKTGNVSIGDYKAKKRQTILSYLFRLTLSIILIYVIIRAVDMHKVLSLLRGIDPWVFFIAYLTVLLGAFPSAYAWKMLMRIQKLRVPFLRVVYMNLVGFFFNSYLPTGVGGDIWRGFTLSRVSEKTGGSVASVIMERVTAFGSIVLLGLFSFFLNMEKFSEAGILGGVSLFFGIITVVFLGAIFIGPYVLGRLNGNQSAVEKDENVITNAENIENNSSNKKGSNDYSDKDKLSSKSSIKNSPPLIPPASGGEEISPASGREVIFPASGGEVISPTSGREVISPASGREVISPTSGREVISPTGGRGVISPLEEGGQRGEQKKDNISRKHLNLEKKSKRESPLNRIISFFLKKAGLYDANLSSLKEGLAGYRKSPLTLLGALLMTSLSPLLECLTYILIINSLNLDVSYLPVFMLVPLLRFINHIPVSVNSIGTQDLTLLLFWKPLGLSPEQALSISILMHLLRLLVGATGGLLYVAFPYEGESETRHKKL